MMREEGSSSHVNGDNPRQNNRNHTYYDDDDGGDDEGSYHDLHQFNNNNKNTNNQDRRSMFANSKYFNESNANNNNHTNNYNNNHDSTISALDIGGIEDDEQNRNLMMHPNHNQPQPKQNRKCWCCRCCTWKNIKNYCSQCFLPKCEWRGLCACPHGRCYGMMGVLTAQGGLMMNLYVLGTCKFNRITILNPVTGEPIPGSERSYGFDARETNYGQTPDYRECTYYPDEELDEIWDSWMSSAKFFSYVSGVLAVLFFLILFSICCVAYSKTMFERWLFWGYIIAAISISFSFLVFGSEFCKMNECKVADGCGWALSCFFFHLMAANTVKNFPEPKPKPNKNDKAPPTIDEVYDELYYDDEDDKYPPPLPDGKKRGVIFNENGEPEFDNGEDYFDDLGNFVDPDKKDDYHRTRTGDDDEYDEDGSEYEDGSDYTDGSYDSDDDEEYDSDEDSETRKKRREDKKAEKEAKKAAEQQNGADDNQQQPFKEYNPYEMGETDDPLTGMPYVNPSSSSKQQEPQYDDPLSGIPYSDPSRHHREHYIRPDEREFSIDDDENRGNLGVGYEHLDPKTRQPPKQTQARLYGAPSRPNLAPAPLPDHSDNDDGPVMA